MMKRTSIGRMRIVIAVLAIAAVMSLGVAGTITTISHTHCDDPDHSAHDSCPICQFSIQGFFATIPDPYGIVVILFALYCLAAIKSLCTRLSYHLASSRAPPIPA